MSKFDYLLSPKETACLASACLSASEDGADGTSPLEAAAACTCDGYEMVVSEYKVNKAIEERAISYSKKGTRRMLPDSAVIYLAYTSLANDLTLSRKAKSDLFEWMSDFRSRFAQGEDTSNFVFNVGPMMELKPEKRFESWVRLIDSYCSAKESYILEDPKIMGGSPVIRGSRITAHSVVNRLDGGDTLKEIIEENPDIPAEAFEAAIIYARSHPKRGRPKGVRAI